MIIKLLHLMCVIVEWFCGRTKRKKTASIIEISQQESIHCRRESGHVIGM